MKKLLFVGLLIALIFPTFSFFLGNKMFTFNDETQMANFHQYFKAIDLKQFPPRWAVDMNFEYGSPFLSFNYQLPYYLGYLGHLAGLPITVTFKYLLALTFVVGALGMFSLGLVLTGSTLFSLFAGVLYSYTPYQSIDHYVRGTIGECFALALLPWLFLSCYQLIRKKTALRFLASGLLFGLLVISHQPAALFTIPLFLAIFGATALLSKKVSALVDLVKSVFLGLILSAYYWVPVIFEKKYIQATSPFNYKDQFPFIWQLIYSRWTYTGANPFSTDTFSFQIGIVNLLVLGLAALIVVLSFARKTKATLDLWLTRSLVLATLVVVFLMNIRSDFIWRSLPLIQVIQFPWRLLMFTTLFSPVLFLFVIKAIPKPWASYLTLVLLIATMLLNVSYFKPGLIIDHDDAYFLHRFLPRVALQPGESISSGYLQHTEDYVPLPIWATRPKTLPAAKLTPLYKSTKIEVIAANPLSYHAKIDNKVSETITFHTFYYPGWELSFNGAQAQIQKDEIGAITFNLPPGSREVAITFRETPIRQVSNIISLASLVLVGLNLIYYLRNKRASTTA